MNQIKCPFCRKIKDDVRSRPCYENPTSIKQTEMITFSCLECFETINNIADRRKNKNWERAKEAINRLRKSFTTTFTEAATDLNVSNFNIAFVHPEKVVFEKIESLFFTVIFTFENNGKIVNADYTLRMYFNVWDEKHDRCDINLNIYNLPDNSVYVKNGNNIELIHFNLDNIPDYILEMFLVYAHDKEVIEYFKEV